MSGSRGEANFVWRCKNCKGVEAHGPPNSPTQAEHVLTRTSESLRRRLKAAPTAYAQARAADSPEDTRV